MKPESPGRTLQGGCPALPESAGSGGKRVKGGVSGVLKYFKQKKASTPQEDEFHRFRILHNRLLQWRFVNAKAEAAMAGVKRVAQVRFQKKKKKKKKLIIIIIQPLNLLFKFLP